MSIDEIEVIRKEKGDFTTFKNREKFYCEGGRCAVGQGYDQWGLRN